ncbi:MULTISPECIES: FAD-dependent oxidoreductase [unclassified Sphingopyxis]|uniref:FAD-dependent oxidoreductase n=1 Tax=unclassified Sphingopyxis TaxID=2614943 RepID=UPI0028631618|nr:MULTISPECIES: FAD-dependent oxidoreductase [unclassified Sphingopyxis]MDR6831773.1 thioredoxin reductase (NADPH) [Sphingopyxis sp. BE122]MDR7227515.1 thioredoxin reductase (NADPH) [Sphingopyxis sp. BE259]
MVTPADVNHTFSDAELQELLAFGTVESHRAGDLIIEEGAMAPDCIITLSGHTDIFASTDEGRKRVGWMERGQFAGDLSVLTGQRHLSRVEMGADGEILRIKHADFQRLIAGNSHYSDIFVRVLSARREFSNQRGFAVTIVIGAAMDRSVYALRDLLMKHGVAHRWFDPVDGPVAGHLMGERNINGEQLPVVILGAADVLVQPTPEQLAAALGLDLLPDGSTADVIVVGSGPGGLAAAVYAASEGLTVIGLDALAPGGQAGTSSKIENYLGFPTGISGNELARRATVQAQKFGARLVAPVRGTAIMRDEDVYCLHLADGRKLRSRAVVVASGAQYQRLPIEGIEAYEGRGIYYGATPMEAQLCGNAEVTVVGSGNSAGQGAIYLAGVAKKVYVIFRRKSLRETMSEYLVRRLEDHPNIEIIPSTDVVALHGDDGLAGLTYRDRETGEEGHCDCRFLFLFLGASPNTGWLPKEMVCDERGFVKTGADISPMELVKAGWSLDRMPSRYETSWPRIYAIGDVRKGSVKRVASSVGEGSVVVSDIHQALAEVGADLN